METTLFIPAFVAGFLTFLAPCTLPIVPGYLAFIGGVSLRDLKDSTQISQARRKILVNALFYILGFSLVFIAFGTIFGGVGVLGIGRFRPILARIGGAFILILGLYLMRVIKIPFLDAERRLVSGATTVKIGKPKSSFLFGATFALGWTPCIGPILGSILLLASTQGSILEGTALLTIFSIGLGLPFFLVALFIGQTSSLLKHLSKYLPTISFVGGLFIAFLGLLILTGKLVLWNGLIYNLLSRFQYDGLLRFF